MHSHSLKLWWDFPTRFERINRAGRHFYYTRVHFCYDMVHCWIWDNCIVGFARLFYRSSCESRRLGITWWRHQMETFSALLAICAGNSPVPGEFPTQRPVTRSFDVFFDLRLNKRLSKQWWGWWFETPLCPLLRHRNEQCHTSTVMTVVSM